VLIGAGVIVYTVTDQLHQSDILALSTRESNFVELFL
jgi:hypothetical protein